MFQSTFCHFETWATSFTPLCLCLLEKTVKVVGPFYLVAMLVLSTWWLCWSFLPGGYVGPFYLVAMPEEVKVVGPFYQVATPEEV